MTSQPTLGFADLALSTPVMDALKRIGYEQPSPIQAEAIPHLLDGHDLIGTAQTGTGKTAAFALPLLSKIDLTVSGPQVLVLAPTRELAIQVAEAFKTYASSMKGFNVLPIYGGQAMDTQLRQLRRGVHVVVGTPGRVMDHLRRKTLKLDNLKTIVLDEGDEMLRMGFIEDVEWILEQTPEQRQVALFSATMPAPIRRVADKYLSSPKVVKIISKTSTVERIEQRFWMVSGLHKLDALTRILEVEDFDGIIMFVRTKALTVELAEKLEARGYSASAINGDMTQALRERTIGQLKKGQIDILVATDVAARGIDVARISHVVNYDIPYDTEAYVHRIGRTGRAGRTGKAILFVAPRERRLLRAIENATRQPIKPMELPTRQQVNEKRANDFKATLTQVMSNKKLDFFHQLIQSYIEEHDADPIQLAGALAYLAQKDKPLMLEESSKKSSAKEGKSPRQDASIKGERRSKSLRPDKDDLPKSKRGNPKVPMDNYRIEVGKNHNVMPGDIVGAIANEADVEPRHIGHIELNEDHSYIELPVGMPKIVFQSLKKIRVRNQPLNIERTDHVAKPAATSAKPAKGKKKTYTKKPKKKKTKSF
ncbi:MAG: ATP-dependent RNA helicase DeaD [Cycloclasticus pugetii]|jgi:ATP-dependent RNA helicase DeaD|uniref:ATP-dependent RNA helicase DeaD n=2 Tax=Cycloclasticus TaxID=34067 RepID=S5TVZ5_9GAMM|nr:MULTISPECIES: DEAD/DEAH box helicase [Cycloclasticus]AFT67530.1 ATP-dependent RNA helicase DeaD-like protein [Cycloclasticus sp. P1]AGS39300.1 ATP-dependent RNA helicase DeaD [Cycloclasticus zancles 78-ME]ATI02919.1 ATP-dependent helicase [Cycloclasticus sp. PY97N]EPD13671.1 ATP-dependent RNA helicase DeaD-like protein [Cycloclasticus pugetii]PHR48537.1 MAG: ATP-dependent RNA helicase [Cycloclasticus sp.]